MKAKSSKAQRLSYAQVMKELKAAGTAQTRKTLARHGVTSECFGVSYAFFKELDKRVENDQELAEKLWASGNYDARIFACWIAEEDKVTHKLLDSWARDLVDAPLGSELAALAAYTSLGAVRSRKWRAMKNDIRAAMGWQILAKLAMEPNRPTSEGGVLDEELHECLVEIEAKIHDAPNRTKQMMNQALIAIGCRASMTKEALAAAKRVGPVEVDQGNTSCKTDVAYDKIRKTVEHYAAQGKVPTDGSSGQRRRHC